MNENAMDTKSHVRWCHAIAQKHPVCLPEASPRKQNVITNPNKKKRSIRYLKSPRINLRKNGALLRHSLNLDIRDTTRKK